MALSSSLFMDKVVADVLLADFRRNSAVFNAFSTSPQAQALLAQALAGGPAGGFAKKITVPRLNQSALNPTDGYTAASYPGSEDVDLSGAYAVLTDDSSVIDINKHFIGTHRLPDVHALTHAAGGLLADAKLQADMQEIKDNIEESFLNEMLSSARYESVSAGVPSRFNLDTSSAANLKSDIGILLGDMGVQNVPEGERKFLILNPSVQGKLLQWTDVITKDIMSEGNADFGDGVIYKVGGFDLLFSNSMSSDSGLVIAQSRAAIVMPTGFQVEQLRDKDTIGTYSRVWCVAGSAALGKVVNAADGDSWSTSREGINAISVS